MKIPKKQSDILAKTYVNFQNYITTTEDKPENVLANTLKIFYNITEKDIKNIPYTHLLDMQKIIENILKYPTKLINRFKIEGIEYGLLPNFDDMILSEYIDCDTDDIIRQISVLYRPIIKKKRNKYLIEKYIPSEDRYILFKEKLTLDIYLGFIGFFLTIEQELLNYIQNYLKAEQDLNLNQKKTSQVNGDGIRGFTDYVQKI